MATCAVLCGAERAWDAAKFSQHVQRGSRLSHLLPRTDLPRWVNKPLKPLLSSGHNYQKIAPEPSAKEI